MSKVEVNTVDAQCGTTVTIGSAGKTVSVPGNIVKSNAIQASDGGNIIDQCGTTVTLGATGDTVSLASGASATGFGLSWCATVKTGAFCAAAGKGYFVNTTAGGITVTLPAAPSIGDSLQITDFAGTAATNAITLGRNSLKIKGACKCGTIDQDRGSVRVVYTGTTQGWINSLDAVEGRIAQAYNVQYLVVAGGAGSAGAKAGSAGGGGGGAGGLRNVATKSFAVLPGTPYSITVGGGGAAGSGASITKGTPGDDSIFSTITSAGGGGGAMEATGPVNAAGLPGGSGGGAGYGATGTGGTGNIPCVSPAQGTDGGNGGPPGASYGSGAGGGHSCAGGAGTTSVGGAGGAGTVCGIRGTPFDPVAYAGGGGGAIFGPGTTTGGAGGGGAGGGYPNVGTAGGTNTGGGGGGSSGGPGPSPVRCGQLGGSGIVIIRRLTACGTSTSGTVTTCGSDTIHTFLGDGTFVA